jgi:hypothetical protein
MRRTATRRIACRPLDRKGRINTTAGQNHGHLAVHGADKDAIRFPMIAPAAAVLSVRVFR